ncbi:hypothetical protein [Paracoccus alcaliphilus]|uniref:hypothetical protein n=1 Tax=Paracoccus alcaliphilus TaxID=34002 RepID=UPI003AF31ACC
MRSGCLIHTQAEAQDRCQRAVQLDLGQHPLALAGNRRDHDAVDQATDRVAGLALGLRFRQVGDQRLDPVVIGIGDARMQARRRGGRGGGEFFFQLLLASFELLHLRFDPFGRSAGQNGIHQDILVLDNLGQFLLSDRAIIDMAGGQPVALGDVFRDEDLDQVRIHQVIGQDRQDPSLQILPGHAGAIGAV